MSSVSRTSRPVFVSDQQSQFPLETLSEEQRDVFRRFITIRREDWFNIHQPIWFALVLTRDRPASLISTLETHPESDLPEVSTTELAEVFDLQYRRLSDDDIVVSRTQWRLDMLPTSDTDVNNAFHRRYGCTLGYPRYDIEKFIENETVTCDWDGSLSLEGFDKKELAYTTFVPYQPADSADGIKRAITTGKSNRQTIAECANQWRIPALDNFANLIYYDELTKLTLL